MGQHDQEPRVPAGLDVIDHDALCADLLPVLERHGIVADGERLDGWIGVLRFTGWTDTRHEYRRVDLITSRGITLGDARQMFSEGATLLDS